MSRAPLPKEAAVARAVHAFIAFQFIVPALSYALQPSIAVDQLNQVSALLGGAPLTVHEHQGYPWHMLAVGNVMTLGFMNVLLAWDLRRFQGILPGLLFLKGFSSLYSLWLGLAGGPRFFFAIFLLDGVTAVAMWAAARYGLRGFARSASASPSGATVAP